MTGVRAALLLVVACGRSADPPPAPPEAIAFVDVTVVPMDRPRSRPHHTVVVRGGRIVAVGPAETTPVPDGARQIDGRGKWLVPGLADMHVHTYDPRQLALLASWGVTTIRVMWGDPGALGARDAMKAGEWRLAPSIYTAGSIVDGDPPVWPGSTGVSSPTEAIEEVARQKRAGYDFVKVYARLSPESYDAIVAAAAKAGLPVIGHVPSAVGLARVLAAKQRSIEHLDGYFTFAQRADAPAKVERVAAYKYLDDAKLADAVARTKAAGTWNCPTLVVRDRLANMDRPEPAKPEFRFIPPAQLDSWDPKKDFRFQSATANDFDTARDGLGAGLALVKRLSDAGAGILAGTDVGNPWLVPGLSLHQELELLVAAKLTPYEALRAATAGPAQFLHAETELGTVAVGRRADLVLVDGDPLANIANTQRIAGVMLRGRWLTAAELVAEREMIAATYRGDRSRFDPPPPGPKPIFTARYRDTGPLSGEERVTVSGRDRALQLVGEMRTDGDSDARWELELGPSGNGRRMRVVQDGLDVVMARDGDRVRITGRLGADTVKLDEAIADDEVFGGAALGIDVAFQRRLAPIAIGDSADVKLAVLELRPTVAIQRLTLSARRLPDKQRTVGGKPVAIRVYSLAVFVRSKLGFFARPNGLELDADGWPITTATATRIE